MTWHSTLPGEFQLISRYFAPLAKGFPGAFGLLDDAAVIVPASGHDLVAKTDAIVGGVHFLPDDPPDLIARKALRVNLSDLAAKGAIPRAYMLDLVLPGSVDEEWVAAFARGLAQDQGEYGVHLIGGDTDSTPGPIVVAIMAFGEVASGKLLRRRGARVGDIIYVSGTIGDATLGLAVLRDGLPTPDEISAAFLVERYRLPLPRVALGPRLIGLASATIDISDGLIADLRHICEVSEVAAVVEASCVPLSPVARAVISADPARLATALTGGDDYEILFTAPPAAAGPLADLARELAVPITAIGRVTAIATESHERVSVLNAMGEPLLFGTEGWTHF